MITQICDQIIRDLSSRKVLCSYFFSILIFMTLIIDYGVILYLPSLLSVVRGFVLLFEIQNFLKMLN